MLNHITTEELNRLYWVERKNGREIADMFRCTPGAVSRRMKADGIATRHSSDYPPSEKQKAAWIENGKRLSKTEGSIMARATAGKANKGKRRRNDYEFGGHEKRRTDGYIKVYVPDHPNSTTDGYVMKHILVMEREIGRTLHPGEVVHHVNRIRDDNRIENLRLMTVSEHMSMHMLERHAARRAEQC